MRVPGLIVCLMVSGCAANAPVGLHGASGKSGFDAFDSQYDIGATDAVAAGATCGARATLWCTVNGHKSSCACVDEAAVEEQLRRSTDMREHGAYRGQNGMRRRN